jgi:hypothetical protein
MFADISQQPYAIPRSSLQVRKRKAEQRSGLRKFMPPLARRRRQQIMAISTTLKREYPVYERDEEPANEFQYDHISEENDQDTAEEMFSHRSAANAQRWIMLNGRPQANVTKI